jgi:hypothetical protein
MSKSSVFKPNAGKTFVFRSLTSWTLAVISRKFADRILSIVTRTQQTFRLRMALRIPRFVSIPRPPLQPRIHFSFPVRTYAKVDKKNPTQWKVKPSMLDDDKRALHRFIQGFKPEYFPRDICTVTFSRSSGPGGQNVNKYTSLLVLADEG